METGFDSLEKSSDFTTGASPPSLPSSIVAVKKLARSKKVMGKKVVQSFEEDRWDEKRENDEISEEARKAWEVGKKLGLLSKILDEDMRWQIEQLEKEDKAQSRKSKKSAKKGATRVN